MTEQVKKAVDFDELKTRPVKDVTVTFIHETRAGEVITLEKVRTENEDGTITTYWNKIYKNE